MEDRQKIVVAIQEADMEATLFLMGFDAGMDILKKIIDEAVKERNDTFDAGIDIIFEDFGPDGEPEPEKEELSAFAKRYARKVRNAGTDEWIRIMSKDTAEMLINGIHAVQGYNCKIHLGNGESFDEWELSKAWEAAHEERLCRKGNWDIF